MNRHQRRKRSLLRKADKLRKLEKQAAISRKLDANRREADFRTRDRLPSHIQRKVDAALGRNVCNATTVVQLPGFGTGSFKRDSSSMDDSELSGFRHRIKRRVDKATR
jgi:hypothetical protein